MPERGRRQTITLLLSLSLVSLVVLATGTPGAVAAQTSPSSPGSSSPSTSSPSSSSKKKPAPCPDAASPPPIPPGAGDDTGRPPPVPGALPAPLDIPDEPVGGDRMGECGVVLPANAPLPPDGLTAAAWLIADQTTGEVLAANAPHHRHHPASLVKVLLAIVVLRELDPNAIVIGATEDTAYTGKVGVVADAKYTVRDLVRALIVTPANDAASALARQLGGEPVAVQKVNALARELGALDTRATNATGLDEPGMSTSAYDAALIYREAMRSPEFALASGAKSVVITAQGGRTKRITRSNDNALLTNYPGATGGKAGLTDAAKSTFAGSADRGGKRLVVTLLRTEKTGDAPFDQAASLLDYGYALAAAGTQPVGQLVGEDHTAPAPTTQDPALQAELTDNEYLGDTGSRTAFGTVGLPITIGAGIVVVIAGMMTVRRKMARARQQRAAQH